MPPLIAWDAWRKATRWARWAVRPAAISAAGCGNDNRRALGEAGDHVARDGCSAWPRLRPPTPVCRAAGSLWCGGHDRAPRRESTGPGVWRRRRGPDRSACRMRCRARVSSPHRRGTSIPPPARSASRRCRSASPSAAPSTFRALAAQPRPSPLGPAGGAGGGRVPAPYRDTALLTVLGGELIGPGQQRHAQRTQVQNKPGRRRRPPARRSTARRPQRGRRRTGPTSLAVHRP
jgi:hypothetical protein